MPGATANATTPPPSAPAPAVSYTVELSWDIPNSPLDPVAGYNVYRSAGSSALYELLNTAAVVATPSWSDTTVQSGSTYGYIVKSVDGQGIESSPSNAIEIAVP